MGSMTVHTIAPGIIFVDDDDDDDDDDVLLPLLPFSLDKDRDLFFDFWPKVNCNYYYDII